MNKNFLELLDAGIYSIVALLIISISAIVYVAIKEITFRVKRFFKKWRDKKNE